VQLGGINQDMPTLVISTSYHTILFRHAVILERGLVGQIDPFFFFFLHRSGQCFTPERSRLISRWIVVLRTVGLANYSRQVDYLPNYFSLELWLSGFKLRLSSRPLCMRLSSHATTSLHSIRHEAAGAHPLGCPGLSIMAVITITFHSCSGSCDTR
jgi:hypothetical protein